MKQKFSISEINFDVFIQVQETDFTQSESKKDFFK